MRYFSRSQRLALYYASDGKCSMCGRDLPEGWHADHIHPFAHGGITDVINGQALCPQCNQSKGDKLMFDKPNVVLRTWQQEEQEAFQTHDGKWFTLVATPGAGKTVAMLNNAFFMLRSGKADFIVGVVPSETLKHQWKEKARTHFGLNLKANFEGYVTDEFDGVMVTYQALAGSFSKDAVRQLHRGRRIFTIFDEPHHMADGKSWGAAAQYALSSLSVGGVLGTGTPFRSDDYAIPIVEYMPVGDGGHKLVSHYDYLYEDALIDQVVRAICFRKIDSEATWYSFSDEIVTANFDEDLNERQMNERLRTVLDANSEFVTNVLRQSYAELKVIRNNEQANAKMLIICKDTRHANAIADKFEKLNGFRPVIVTSDDEHGDREDIVAFKDSSDPVIIAVAMISEGVDIPPLRSLVYLTDITAPLFFYQAIGRIVRVERGRELDNGYVYIPRDPRLVSYAKDIMERRNHVLKAVARELPSGVKDKIKDVAAPRQVSIYEPMSATFIDDGIIYSSEDYTIDEIRLAESWIKTNGLRITVEEACKIQRIQVKAVAPTKEAIGLGPDPERMQKDLRNTANRLAYRLAKMRGDDIQTIHSEWVFEHNGKWQHQETIKGLERKVKWLKSQLAESNNWNAS